MVEWRTPAPSGVHAEHAVWDGRFQPFHVGHLAVIEAICRQFQRPVVVMVIQSEEVESQDDYVNEVNRHHRAARNPLTLWERYSLITMALANESFGSNVTVIGIPRPDLHWTCARSFYPHNRFICLTGKDEYENRKAGFWRSLGERTRIVDIDGIPRISATEVKQLCKEGRGWERYLPESCIEYFNAIDAPRRFAEAPI